MSPSSTRSKKILVGVTGSIAAYKTAALVSKLVQNDFEVQVVATASALQFVGNATFEGLTRRPVKTAIFAEGAMMDHIELARWADTYVIAPCTANTLADLALGKAADLVTALALAFQNRTEIYLAPAMNTQMWEHPAVSKNLELVRSYGYQIIQPNAGRLACGEIGAGKMAEPEEIFNTLNKRPPMLGKVLVTLGGTRESIDAVRSITNTSTGQTGVDICIELLKAGYEVHALAARSSAGALEQIPQVLKRDLHIDFFESHASLENLLKSKLNAVTFDHVVHLAAVSDYTVESLNVDGKIHTAASDFKIGSTHSLSINLMKTSKLINQIRHWSQSPIKTLIGFKLTHGANAIEKDRAIREVLDHGAVDVVVHNDQLQFHQDRKIHRFGVFQKNGAEKYATGTKELTSIFLEIFNRPETTILKSSHHNLEKPLFKLEGPDASMS